MNRRPYPTDVGDEEWALILPYLSLAPLDASQRKHDLREVFNALRWPVRTPHDFPPPQIVQAQAYRWMWRGA